MDTQTLISNIRTRFNHLESKKYLQEKYSNQLLLPFGGGLWRITTEFLAMLKSIDSEIILVDTYNAPVKVNSSELYLEGLALYNEVMSQWLEEYSGLSKTR
jgi:hypothetical protein